ncbi:MAG TPA: hypothetical protein VEI97_06330 [bacterium]|nr:hypothetical protein [bacterium]
MSDHDVTLGTLPGDGDGRDAIHIAIVPLIAATQLYPGDHVGLVGTDKVSTNARPFIGIIDPFLQGREARIRQGQKVWVCLYPRSITGLRHVWTHPAFPEEEKPNDGLEGMVVRVPSPLSEAEQWIRNYAEGYGFSYEEMMRAAKEHLEAERRGGYSDGLCGGAEMEGEYTSPEFWRKYQEVTGERVDDIETNFFRCAC